MLFLYFYFGSKIQFDIRWGHLSLWSNTLSHYTAPYLTQNLCWQQNRQEDRTTKIKHTKKILKLKLLKPYTFTISRRWTMNQIRQSRTVFTFTIFRSINYNHITPLLNKQEMNMDNLMYIALTWGKNDVIRVNRI